MYRRRDVSWLSPHPSPNRLPPTFSLEPTVLVQRDGLNAHIALHKQVTARLIQDVQRLPPSPARKSISASHVRPSLSPPRLDCDYKWKGAFLAHFLALKPAQSQHSLFTV
ncbi:hypothetical protein NDU88_007185 [Pleurodeles waltl]|uniref:Uncharacterized protein n=1 Tax=Pleurodeles waltl TaxID=8319 RepID=A0AAV7MG82_PLEWA|nr:hypothetical protein NDU88_007185 [Pleurodeles waltl]